MQYNTVEYNAIQSCNRSLGFAKGLAHLQWLQNVQQAQQCCGGCGSCRGIAIGPILSTDMHFWSYVWAQVKCVGCCKSSSGFNSTIICNKNYEFAFGFEIKCNNCVFQVLKAVATVANWGQPPPRGNELQLQGGSTPLSPNCCCSCIGGWPPPPQKSFCSNVFKGQRMYRQMSKSFPYMVWSVHEYCAGQHSRDWYGCLDMGICCAIPSVDVCESLHC